MNCRDLEEKLPLLLREPVPAALREEAEAHCRECADCRLLLSLARGESSSLDAAGSRDLERSILEKTSGQACRRVEELLAERSGAAPSHFVAKVTQPRFISPDEELLAQHLDSCRDCRDLAAALSFLDAELPRMAEVQPDPRLLPAILDRTSRHGPARPTWTELLAEWWTSTVHRPRIALEAAYVGAFLVFLIAGSPAPLLRKVAQGPVNRARHELAAGFSSLELRRLSLNQGHQGPSGGEPAVALSLPHTGAKAAPALAERVLRGFRVLSLAGTYGPVMGRELLHGDMVGLWGAFGELRAEARARWNGTERAPARDESTEPRPDGVRTEEHDRPEIQP